MKNFTFHILFMNKSLLIIVCVSLVNKYILCMCSRTQTRTRIHTHTHTYTCFLVLETAILALMSITDSMLTELAHVTLIYLWH